MPPRKLKKWPYGFKKWAYGNTVGHVLFDATVQRLVAVVQQTTQHVLLERIRESLALRTNVVGVVVSVEIVGEPWLQFVQHVVARHGGGDDPHGVILGDRVTGALLRHTRAAGIDSARTVSVKVGRTGCTVRFEAPLEQRPRLEAILRTASHLARRLRVARSADQDVVVELEGIQREVLERVVLEECPLLLCIGLQPDTRAYLAGWEALGHLVVATQAGTSDAHEHLASLVGTLAGQCPPTELQLYTLAPRDTLLGQLGPLPHQRAVVDPADRAEATQLVATLRAELERRQGQILDPQVPQLVLVVSELAQIAGEEDLRFLLTHGSGFRVRVVAATADTALERDLLVDGFESRLVFALEDEEASTRLLGKAWALTLAEPGRLLARLGQRKEVEILGLHLTEDGRRDLLASWRSARGPHRSIRPRATTRRLVSSSRSAKRSRKVSPPRRRALGGRKKAMEAMKR